MGTVYASEEFYAEEWQYVVIVAPGQRGISRNMIKDTSRTDVARIMVPVVGNLTNAIVKGDYTAREIQGPVQQHSCRSGISGVWQIFIGVDREDWVSAAQLQSEYGGIANDRRAF